MSINFIFIKSYLYSTSSCQFTKRNFVSNNIKAFVCQFFLIFETSKGPVLRRPATVTISKPQQNVISAIIRWHSSELGRVFKCYTNSLFGHLLCTSRRSRHLTFPDIVGHVCYSLLKGRKTVDRDEETESHEVEGGSSLKDEVCGATTISG